MPKHSCNIRTIWTGNRGGGTSSYRAYSRDYEITAPEKTAPIAGSSDPAFRGDPSRYSPEELLIASLSACHMLWMLHLCADAGITVIRYEDSARGILTENGDGSGQFTEVTLEPVLAITDSARLYDLEALHSRAHELCFIARSVKFPVHVRGRAEAVKSL